MSASRPLISVIVPTFNEERNVARAHRAIAEEFDRLAGRYRFELIFSDNHSTDGTFAELRALAAADPRVKVLRLARNFGFQRSVLTAYRHASGVAAIQIDCDLQDPPRLIGEFLARWEDGHDVVVGIRRRRRENPLLQLARRGFYKLLHHLSDENLVENAGDFRLVDRSILDQLHRIRDAQPYLRGLISSLAAHQTGVVYDRERRLYERSKFPVRRLLGLAADGIVSHSTWPLRLATWFGVATWAVTVLLALYYLAARLLVGQRWPAGFATTTILLLVAIGMNGIFMGIVGEYVGRIYNEVRVRPTAVIEETINFDETRAAASTAEGHGR